MDTTVVECRHRVGAQPHLVQFDFQGLFQHLQVIRTGMIVRLGVTMVNPGAIAAKAKALRRAQGAASLHLSQAVRG